MIPDRRRYNRHSGEENLACFTNSVKNVLSITPNQAERNSYDLFNLRLGLRADRFDIESFVENLCNEKYATGAIGSVAIRQSFGVSDLVDVGATRRFGIRAGMRF